MYPTRLAALLVCLASALSAVSARADDFRFVLGPGDVAGHALHTTPRVTPLLPSVGGLLKKAPADLVAPRYALIRMGPIESKIDFIVALDEQPGKDPRLIVDVNHNGDLTDDPPVTWTRSTYSSFDGKTLNRWLGDATLQVPCGKTTLPLTLHFLIGDPHDPNAALTQDRLVYAPAYALHGKLKLGSDSYDAMLFDIEARGEFRANVSKVFSGDMLLLDVNHNGRYDERNDMYDLAKPFTIKGVTYRLSVPDPDGGSVEVTRSDQAVPEILPPPDIRVGASAPAFTVKTMDGKTVHFPDDYKGKKVLLYFWASYCPHCATQSPYMVRAYQTYHARGLEVLGINVDAPGQDQQIAQFIGRYGMSWPEVYDGGSWKTPAADLYEMGQIPTPLLVDGDTGKFLAVRPDLLADGLNKTLAKVFAPSRP